MTIHIGAMMPDRSLDESVFIKAVTKIAANLARLRDLHTQNRTPVLDIIYLLPSQKEKADFTGLRLRSFDSSGQILRIESAVEESMVSSIHAERYVLAVLLDAIDAAKSLEALNIPGFDFHPLRGKPKRYSIHVNGPWCITFEWEGENTFRVNLETSH